VSGKKLTLDDVTVNRRFKVVTAPEWAYDRDYFGRYVANKEAWADLLAELERQARNWLRRAKRQHAKNLVAHAKFIEDVNAGRLTEMQKAWMSLHARFGSDLTQPPPPPTMPKIRAMYVGNYTPRWRCRHCFCNKWFFSDSGGASRYCSTKCRKAERQYRSERRPRKSRAKRVEGRDCAHCGKFFVPRRSDSRTCSVKCRVAAHRAQK
jgi:hypothetical protein